MNNISKVKVHLKTSSGNVNIYDAMFLGKISVHLEGVKSLAVGCVGYEDEVESSDENNLEEVQKSVHSEPIVDTESGKKSIKGLYRTLVKSV